MQRYANHSLGDLRAYTYILGRPAAALVPRHHESSCEAPHTYRCVHARIYARTCGASLHGIATVICDGALFSLLHLSMLSEDGIPTFALKSLCESLLVSSALPTRRHAATLPQSSQYSCCRKIREKGLPSSRALASSLWWLFASSSCALTSDKFLSLSWGGVSIRVFDSTCQVLCYDSAHVAKGTEQTWISAPPCSSVACCRRTSSLISWSHLLFRLSALSASRWATFFHSSTCCCIWFIFL